MAVHHMARHREGQINTAHLEHRQRVKYSVLYTRGDDMAHCTRPATPATYASNIRMAQCTRGGMTWHTVQRWASDIEAVDWLS